MIVKYENIVNSLMIIYLKMFIRLVYFWKIFFFKIDIRIILKI